MRKKTDEEIAKECEDERKRNPGVMHLKSGDVYVNKHGKRVVFLGYNIYGRCPSWQDEEVYKRLNNA